MKFVILALLFSSTLAQVIQLYARSLVDNSKISLGSIDVDSKKLTLQESIEGEYCIGTDDIADSECISYYNGKLNEFGVNVYLDESGNVEFISLGSDGVTVHPFNEGAKPNLNPVVKSKAKGKTPKVEKVIQKKLVKIIDEDGNEQEQEQEVEVEVAVDERSFIQKNWIYIVIPLIMFLMATGEGKGESK